MGDTGLDRPQDHRRHLRRRGAARRRRVLGQGPDEGRPLGRLRGALRREERRRGGSRRPLPDPGRLRDRRRASVLDPRRLLRHRARRSPDARSRSSSASTSTCARPRSCATSTCAGRSTRRPPRTATSAATIPTSRGSGTDKADALRAAAGLAPRPPEPLRELDARALGVTPPGRTNRPGGGFSPIAARRRRGATRNWPAARLGRLDLDSRRARSPRRRTSAGGRRRARRAARSSRAPPGSRSDERLELAVLGLLERPVSTGQPCGQRSGCPSRSSIRSTMSSVNVSPSSSAWTWASAAV